jgi:hypothetical protein
MVSGPDSECQRFRKASRAHAQEFELIDRRGKIAEFHDFEEMFRIVEIQAWQLLKLNAVRKLRIRRTREHIYLMTEVFEGMTKVFYVNPLPAAGRIPAVSQQADPESAISVFSLNGIGTGLFQRAPSSLFRLTPPSTDISRRMEYIRPYE